jgi:hypothetical protein
MVRVAPAPLSPRSHVFIRSTDDDRIWHFNLVQADFTDQAISHKKSSRLIDESHPADRDGRIKDLAPCNPGILGVVNSRISSKNSVSLVNEI